MRVIASDEAKLSALGSRLQLLNQSVTVQSNPNTTMLKFAPTTRRGTRQSALNSLLQSPFPIRACVSHKRAREADRGTVPGLLWGYGRR